MKSLIAAVLMTLTFSVSANQITCAHIEELAETIMTARQNEASITAMLAVAQDGSKGSILANKIIMAAYDVPAFNTEANKARAIRNFANKIAIACIKGR